jgi:hypothetical protein
MTNLKRTLFQIIALIVLLFVWFILKTYFVKDRVPALSIEQIANGGVPAIWSDNDGIVTLIPLKNGSYEESIRFSAEVRRTVTADLVMATSSYAVADLNNDGAKDILAVLVSNTGGTGHFFQLLAYLNKKGEPEYAGLLSLGDRIDVNEISVNKGVITVDIITQGPDDGFCCPTLRQIKKYTFDGKEFHEVTE